MALTRKLAILSVVIACAVLLAACEQDERPFHVKNERADRISLQIIWVTERPIAFRKSGERAFSRSLLFDPNEEASIESSAVTTRNSYTFIVGTPDGHELFRRTFPREDLEKKEFRLAITETGID